MDRTTLPTAVTPGFVNPLTGHHVTPGKILGYRRDGRPIRVIAGGSGEGDPGGDEDGGSTDDQAGANDGQDDDKTKTPKITGEFDPDRHARALAAAREGEKKAKEARKAADERLAAVLKAAGLTPDGKTDPAEQLKAAAAERDKAVARARETAVELAVYKSAGKAGADPDAVLDSRGFLAQVADLDPDAADFPDKVTAAIKAAVKANPKLASTPTGQGPGKQGTDHSGAGGQKGKPKNLTDAITAKLGGS
ncbi:hypothetical protein GA0074692_6872 [Micromonospora pallida]|uniref:Scaffolding protein n=1 Tax=Micromonospora pallida TaxID=145854 RepID=A0A1C6TNT3_9ACTN|nr:hypothetical protein [Micromonospora pallida]SCL16368.1 hypothetical protein GA0074692_0013 [Micromonospora pallida]SCL43419.1 hypothetical protein GA0074692_6872 [Micromonospora pallida]